MHLIWDDLTYAHNKALSSLDGFRLSKPNRQSTNTIQREPTISDYMRKEFGESLYWMSQRERTNHIKYVHNRYKSWISEEQDDIYSGDELLLPTQKYISQVL